MPYSLESTAFTLKLLKDCRLDTEANIQCLKNLKSGHERMDYAYNYLKKSKLFNSIVNEPKAVKSNEASLNCREEGKKCIQSGQLLEALICFTRSVAHAEQNSPCLAQAYGARSLLLFDKQYFAECLEDIDKAIHNNCPKDLRETLMELKEKAIELKNKQTKLQYYAPIGEIKNKHTLFTAASDCVELKQNKLLGRHLVAVRDINVGEILSVENSFAHSVYPKHKYIHCHQCLNLCYNLLPCPNCVNALYCSVDCKREAYLSYHKYECDVIPLFGNLALNFVKMVIIAYSQLDNEKLQSDKMHRSDRFKEIQDLATNQESMGNVDFLYSIVMACLGYYSLKNHTDMFDCYDIDTNHLKNLMYRCLMIDLINSYFIEKNSLATGRTEQIAWAILAFSSFYCHSCVPNCHSIYHGKQVVTRASANIKKGEACFISYYGDYSTFSKYEYSERRKLLKDVYCFDCCCKACLERWPTFESLPKGKLIGKQITTSNINNTGQESGTDAVESILLEAVPLLDELEQHGPSQNLVTFKTNLIKEMQKLGNQIFDF